MIQTKLNLSSSCEFVCDSYKEPNRSYVSLDYVEHSSDHWHSDSFTSIDIEEQKAKEIIEFLENSFPFLKERK